MNNNKRTFLDYYRDYYTESWEGLFDYGKMFFNWTDVHGYIPRQFTNDIYIYSDFSIDKLYNSNLIRSNRKDEQVKQRVQIEAEVNLMGYRSEIYSLHKELLNDKKHELESSFCNAFIETLFPHVNYNREISESSIDEVRTEIGTYVKGLMSEKPDEFESFLFNFDLFLKNIPNSSPSKEYGFILMKNINHDWQDRGVIIFNKSQLSHEILFYQIGDNN